MRKGVSVSIHVDGAAIEAFIREDPGIQADVDARAERVKRYQQDTVPIDTQNLHDHIAIRHTPDGGREIGVFDQTPLIPADYVLPVEFGYTAVNGRQIPAQPFIRPSTDAAR